MGKRWRQEREKIVTNKAFHVWDCLEWMKTLTLGEDRLLVGEGFQHLGGAGKSVTRLTNAAVDDQLVDLEAAHGVLCLIRCLY